MNNEMAVSAGDSEIIYYIINTINDNDNIFVELKATTPFYEGISQQEFNKVMEFAKQVRLEFIKQGLPSERIIMNAELIEPGIPEAEASIGKSGHVKILLRK
ncbi:hypothetical protein [Mangrovivirga cuniculi]|nr:hypothetical protein [Mangrovivirga cuniculi]